MSSKIFLLACLALAFAVLMVSEVTAARELPETSTEALNNEEYSAKGVEESKYGNGGYPGGGYGGYPGGGYGGRGGYGGGRGGYGGGRGGYGGGGRCRYGCCGRGYYGGCRCCSYAGEAVDAEPQTQP